MRFYPTQHKDYYGIDLHARTPYVCILDQSGEIFVYCPQPRRRFLLTRKDSRGNLP